jgi:uncharacterized membrane protein
MCHYSLWGGVWKKVTLKFFKTNWRHFTILYFSYELSRTSILSLFSSVYLDHKITDHDILRSQAKWRNLEAKWGQNCCAIKIQKKSNDSDCTFFFIFYFTNFTQMLMKMTKKAKRTEFYILLVTRNFNSMVFRK